MKIFAVPMMIVTMCAALTAVVQADTLEMKDGRFIEGKYMGGTQNSIRFQADDKIGVYSTKDILALTFSSVSSSVLQPPKQKDTTTVQTPPAGQSAQRLRQYVIAAGTKIPVRMLNTVELGQNRKDDWFEGELESDLKVDDRVIAPKGSRVKGQVVVSEQKRDGDQLAIVLRELIVKERVIPLTTQNYVLLEEGQNVLDLGLATLKVVTRDRGLRIPQQSIVEFEISDPVMIRFPAR